MAATRTFTATVVADGRRVVVPVPFDPDTAWGPKPVHRVGGTVDGKRVRGVLEAVGDRAALVLGPAWRRDHGVGPGDEVSVMLVPEGPQRDDLAPDLQEAFEADPAAGAFFDGLAQFYRRAYLRYLDGTKRRPDERRRRVAEVVGLCRAGVKERPRE